MIMNSSLAGHILNAGILPLAKNTLTRLKKSTKTKSELFWLLFYLSEADSNSLNTLLH